MELKELLNSVREGTLDIEEAEKQIRREPFEDLGYARIDTHRIIRAGAAEVVFCSGKNDEQLLGIFSRIYEREKEVLGTRASYEQFRLIAEHLSDTEYDPVSGILKIEKKEKMHRGQIAVCTAGTADIPVAEEAAQTAEFLGSRVERIFDIGVSGNGRQVQKGNGTLL